MGYWRNTNSPYDVQQRNGGRFTFETIAKKYEETKPIRGKRKDQNIRPIGQRDRSWERMIKVSDTEYYVSFDYYQYRNHHNRGITWKMENGMEYMTIHTPKKMWTGSNNELYPRYLSSSSVFWFYDFNMPQEFSMANYRANKYVRYQDKYYTIEKGDITFQRKQGGSPTDWQPLVVHREFKHTIDRKQAKELRKLIDPFLPYFDIMCDIVEHKRAYGNHIARVLNDGEIRSTEPEKALALFKHDGEVPEEWLSMVEYYKCDVSTYHWKTETYTYENKGDLREKIAQHLFEIVKPVKTEPVELGKLNNNKYKRWFE